MCVFSCNFVSPICPKHPQPSKTVPHSASRHSVISPQKAACDPNLLNQQISLSRNVQRQNSEEEVEQSWMTGKSDWVSVSVCPESALFSHVPQHVLVLQRRSYEIIYHSLTWALKSLTSSSCWRYSIRISRTMSVFSGGGEVFFRVSRKLPHPPPPVSWLHGWLKLWHDLDVTLDSDMPLCLQRTPADQVCPHDLQGLCNLRNMTNF